MKYKSEALKVIHESAKDKFEIGLISEARMRDYDEMCLVNPKIKKRESPVSSVNIGGRIITAASQQ